MSDRKKKTILFSCFHHSISDPRLYYRQAKTLLAEIPNINIVFVNNFFRQPYGTDFRDDAKDICIVDIHYAESNHSEASAVHPLGQLPFKLVQKTKSAFRRFVAFFEKYYRAFKVKPDITQASDIREILFAVILKITVGSRIIYDAHEDYFNFFYEFSGKTPVGLLKAMWFGFLEFAFLRFFDAVFCTDPFLLDKYSKSIYGLEKCYLLRNFAKLQTNQKHCRYAQKNRLKIVYIGTVNAFRGVIEAGTYVQRFNNEHTNSNTLELHVFSPASPIVRKLQSENKITYHGSLPYDQLMQEITTYDIGLSLLLPLEKYTRNIPMKNFEYMSVGLPVLTSDFGQCKKYIDASGGGICIDPLSYTDFKNAIKKLSDSSKREKMGSLGRKYWRDEASFEREAESYIKEMRCMLRE